MSDEFSIEPTTEKLAIEEIERRYPNEWVVIIDIEDRPDKMLAAGVVVAHGPSKEALRPVARGYHYCALWWTGKLRYQGSTLRQRSLQFLPPRSE